MARRDKEGSWGKEPIDVEAPSEVEFEEPSPKTAVEALSELSEGLNALLRNQLLLARVEAKQEAKGFVRDALTQAFGIPFLLVGYLFLMLAACAALALVLPLWAALLVIAGIHLLAGIGAILVGTRLMRHLQIGFPRTADELRKSRTLAKSLGKAEQQTTAPPSSSGPHQIH